MARLWSNKSTNVRVEFSEAFWSWLSDWTVGEIPTPKFAESDLCESCDAPLARDGRCEQCNLEWDLFHRESRALDA